MRRLDEKISLAVVLAVTLALASAVSCSPSQPPSTAPPSPARITLYEGLPHPLFEAEKLAEERKKPTVEKGGFPFYQAPLALKEADAKLLGTILAKPDSFRPFDGEKKCGGFHPDYALVVSSEGKETSYLICFGCGEAKVFRPDQSETRYDLGSSQFYAILKPYQKNRPEPSTGP